MIYMGKVKWFYDIKGFGFIEPKNGEDVFLHHSSIWMEGYRTLEEGELVFYSLETAPEGLRANLVWRVSENKQQGFVYLLQSGALHKIGFSFDPDIRVLQLKSPTQEPIAKVHLIATEYMRQVELAWHRRFKDKRIPRTEWFRLSADEVREFAKFEKLPMEGEL